MPCNLRFGEQGNGRGTKESSRTKLQEQAAGLSPKCSALNFPNQNTALTLPQLAFEDERPQVMCSGACIFFCLAWTSAGKTFPAFEDGAITNIPLGAVYSLAVRTVEPADADLLTWPEVVLFRTLPGDGGKGAGAGGGDVMPRSRAMAEHGRSQDSVGRIRVRLDDVLLRDRAGEPYELVVGER